MFKKIKRWVRSLSQSQTSSKKDPMTDLSKIVFQAIKAGDSTELLNALNASGLTKQTLVNLVDPRRGTPLIWAVSQSDLHLDIIRILLESGADPNAEVKRTDDYSAITAVSIGVGHLRRDLIELLADFGADLNYLRSGIYGLGDGVARASGRDPRAAMELFSYLKENGVDLERSSDYCESAVRLLAYSGHYQVIRHLESLGVSLDHLSWGPLHRAVAFGDLADVRNAIATGENLERQDTWFQTPFLLAIQISQIEKAKLLLDAGASLSAHNHVGDSALHVAAESDNVEALVWLESLGVDLTESNDHGGNGLKTALEHDCLNAARFFLDRGLHRVQGTYDPVAAEEQKKAMRELLKQFRGEDFPDLPEDMEESMFDFIGQVPDDIEEDLLQAASSVKMLNLLEEYGISLSKLNREGQLLWIGIDEDTFEGLEIPSQKEFEKGRKRRFGKANPEEIHEPLWHYAAKTFENAYSIGQRFGFEPSFSKPEPIWCNQRFGQSMTILEDGRALFIAGEHEDSYDPDFCIYNDLIVFHPDKSVQIFAYPSEVFPPTDFHTATLVGDQIYIIGSLGYLHDRAAPGTPVWKMDVNTYRIEPVVTTGDSPGRICRHHARLLDPGRILTYGGKVSGVRDGESFYEKNPVKSVLNLATLVWTEYQDQTD